MLVLLSPAKSLDFSDNLPANLPLTTPYFIKEAQELVHILQHYSAPEISDLMSISEKLAQLNYLRFQEFNSNPTKPALYAYNGDVYNAFTLSIYSADMLAFANKSLRIISGLYGLLKPFDLIAPYRLDMSIKLPNLQGRDLYKFWQKKVTEKLNESTESVVVNLASIEYSLVIGTLNKPKIDIIFKQMHQGKYQVIGIHAKAARGAMANFIMLNQLTTLGELKKFNLNDYQFSPDLSNEEQYVFIR